MKAFWAGFEKRAEALDGGGGFAAGYGKGVTTANPRAAERTGPTSSPDELTTDKTLLDRERNPKDFALGTGAQQPDFYDEALHVLY